ncbi:hypothetical protein Rctr197k_197 [Virus Rctr197k]|nr:hypothetical protein Rctr197k_197 [Virus Rctr197k]
MHTIVSPFLLPAEVLAVREVSKQVRGWISGRRNTGYEKLELNEGHIERYNFQSFLERARSLLPSGAGVVAAADAYLLWYPNGAYVSPHIDDDDTSTAISRLNVLITKPKLGGILIIEGREVLLEEGEGVIFRPDVQQHSVTPVVGERLVLTFGVAVRKRKEKQWGTERG